MRYNPFAALLAGFVFLIPAAGLTADLDELIRASASSDLNVCLPAIDKLGRAGDDASSAVPPLLKALSRDDALVRQRAARALGSIGAGAKAAVTDLVKALGDDNPKVRSYAAFALGKIGDQSATVVDGLIKTVFDDDPLVRRASLGALRAIDPPQEQVLPVVLKILESGDNSIVMAAMLTLAEEGESVVPRLCKALSNEKACYWICFVLTEIGPDAKEAVPHLKAVLGHKEPETRIQALTALAEIGPPAKPLTADIVALLEKDPFEGVKYAAAFALGKIGVGDTEAAALNKAAEAGDPFLQLLSVWAIARNNPDEKVLVKRAVDLIVAAFNSENVGLRRAAAKAAVDFDVSLDVVAPMLIEALQDKNEAVVRNAIEALVELGPKALKHIDELLEHDQLRFYAIPLVMQLGPKAESAVPALIGALGTDLDSELDIMFVQEIQFALAAIGPAARQAVPELAKALDSNENKIVGSASYALGKIGPAAKAAVPALRENLRSSNAVVRLASIGALLEILPREPRLVMEAVRMFSKGLESENAMVRAQCATALGKIGSPASKAIPRLKPLLEDKSEIVRQAAAEALEQLQ